MWYVELVDYMSYRLWLPYHKEEWLTHNKLIVANAKGTSTRGRLKTRLCSIGHKVGLLNIQSDKVSSDYSASVLPCWIGSEGCALYICCAACGSIEAASQLSIVGDKVWIDDIQRSWAGIGVPSTISDSASCSCRSKNLWKIPLEITGPSPRPRPELEEVRWARISSLVRLTQDTHCVELNALNLISNAALLLSRNT